MDSEDFGSIFGSESDIAYGRSVYDTIKNNRAQLGGELFIDKLLRHIKLDSAGKIYPPRSNKDLRELFKEITNSSRPTHDQQSLIYYILRDLKSRNRDPSQFASNVSLPDQYRIFMDGLWYLDRLKFENAVECLTEPALTPTFPEEILEALLNHAPRESNLGLAYYHAIEPRISKVDVLDLLVDAMCQASLTEAFFVSRSYDGSRRRHVFERILSYVHGHDAGALRAELGVELIGLPLDESEEHWLEECLLHGNGQSLHGARDTVIMRQIAMGRTAEAARFADTAKTRKVDGLDWNLLTQSLQP